MVNIDMFDKPVFTEPQKTRIKLMEEIARAVSEINGKEFVLKGGTGLLLAYGLPRYSTDLDFDGLDRTKSIPANSIMEGAKRAGIPVVSLNPQKNTDTTKRYMLHYAGQDMGKPLKIEFSYRDASERKETDVQNINGIRVYSLEKFCELKTKVFCEDREKPRDAYDLCFLLNKCPQNFDLEMLKRIKGRIDNLGIDYLLQRMESDEIISKQDPESIVLHLEESVQKRIDELVNVTQHEQGGMANREEPESKTLDTVELYPAQPDRVYSGEIISFQDDSAIQEISPGVMFEHPGLASAMCQDDIGKRFTIAYDSQGGVSITQERQLDRGNEIDI